MMHHETTTTINSGTVPVFIHQHDARGTYIISIPEINFSVEYAQNLDPDEQADTIVVHLFNLLDEAECERVAEDIIDATSTK